MSADLLRRAAGLMRERAVGATPGPWEFYATKHYPGIRRAGSASTWAVARAGQSPNSRPTAEYIASWHPAVALAVAKAMDDVAQAWEICDGWTRDLDDDSIRFEDTVDAGWVAVARAYLGESS